MLKIVSLLAVLLAVCLSPLDVRAANSQWRHRQPPSDWVFGPDLRPLLGRALSECDTTALDSFIIRYMDNNHIAGLSACIVKYGETLWAQSYGWAHIARQIPVADSTVFMLASVSKTATGCALTQLYEDSLLDLDENINSYLPFDVVNPNYPDSIITSRMLLSHVSSIKDNWLVLASLYVMGDSPIPLGEFLEDYLVPEGQYYDPHENFNAWPPATSFDYCNVAVALVGYLVEAISGIPFDQYCEENIFAPLQMTETSWFLAGLDTNNIAMPYHWNGNLYEPYGYYGYPDYPDGQLRTSAPQLGRFLTAFMQYGQLDTTRILDSTTVALINSIQYPSIDPTQGLIWYYVTLGDRLLCGHSGGDAGVTTEMYYCPAEDAGVVVLTNGEAPLYEIVQALFDYAENLTPVINPPWPEPAVSDFRLLTISPNPFNLSARIHFELPRPGFIKLELFNLSGQCIAANPEIWHSAGSGALILDATGLASGIYICRLSAHGQRVHGKLVILK